MNIDNIDRWAFFALAHRKDPEKFYRIFCEYILGKSLNSSSCATDSPSPIPTNDTSYDNIDKWAFFAFAHKKDPEEFYRIFCGYILERSLNSLSCATDSPSPIPTNDTSDIKVKTASSLGKSAPELEMSTSTLSSIAKRDHLLPQSKSAKRKAVKASSKRTSKCSSSTLPPNTLASDPSLKQIIAPLTTSSSIVNYMPSANLECYARSMDHKLMHCKSPPPLFIRDKAKWETVSSLMSEQKLHYKSARSSALGIRIKTTTPSDHRGLTSLLRDSGYEYHTYALEDERHLTVVIRGLPVYISTDRILKDLKAQSLPVLSVHRMFRTTTKDPIDLVRVNLELSQEGKKIFNVQVLYYLQIKVEIPRGRRIQGQCHRCQLYGHSQRFCQARPRCVKCLDDHATADCPRKDPVPENPPSCVLCQQVGHPANYRGCPKAPRKAQPAKWPSCYVKLRGNSLVPRQTTVPQANTH